MLPDMTRSSKKLCSSLLIYGVGSGTAIVAKFLMNLIQYDASPKKLRSSRTFFGASHLCNDSLDFAGSVDTPFSENMFQILILSTQEVALAWFELQSRVPQTNEHFPKSCQVFFKITALDDNVVQINRTRRPLKTRQYVFHESLKCVLGTMHNPNGMTLNSYSLW